MSSPSTADASADAYLPSYSPLAWQLDAYLYAPCAASQVCNSTGAYCTVLYHYLPCAAATRSRWLPMALLLAVEHYVLLILRLYISVCAVCDIISRLHFFFRTTRARTQHLQEQGVNPTCAPQSPKRKRHDP